MKWSLSVAFVLLLFAGYNINAQLSFLSDCVPIKGIAISDPSQPIKSTFTEEGHLFSGCIIAAENEWTELFIIRQGLFYARVHYYRDGKPEREIIYKNGQLDGRSAIYYTGGQLRIEEFYSDGKREGTFREWYENGQLSRISEYRNGQLQVEIHYDEKGKELYRRGPE